MPSIAQIGLRSAQFITVLISLALIAAAIDIQRFGNNSVNYAMFTAVISMIVVLYGLAAAFVESLAHPFILMIMDSAALVFNLLAGIILAGYLHVHSCSNRGYVNSNQLTQGSTSRCRELQAATAFFWFSFALFTASIAADFMNKGSSTSMRRRSAARTGPTMTQV
ncbi:428e49fd-2d4d-4570-8040-1f4f53c9fbeb [Sclerotinia trifoliorum]|uniref:428e49fd-2d4d-4570-8040-1f4f53c9fbeb n=1 Tax=Sclerotinia trifoliorum TaxID=28548 RepID=A0A8H2VQQ4_9HELO|nr:428e49fd-2d4d-4570-8040-1f4f53c9fbeb [Sclerotinia trifoliorum]